MSGAAIWWLNIYTLLHSLSPTITLCLQCLPHPVPSILAVTWIRQRLHLQVDIRGPRTWGLCGDQARPCLATGRPSVESLGKIISLGGNWDIQPVVIKYIWNISDRRINTNWVTHNHSRPVLSILLGLEHRWTRCCGDTFGIHKQTMTPPALDTCVICWTHSLFPAPAGCWDSGNIFSSVQRQRTFKKIDLADVVFLWRAKRGGSELSTRDAHIPPRQLIMISPCCTTHPIYVTQDKQLVLPLSSTENLSFWMNVAVYIMISIISESEKLHRIEFCLWYLRSK